MQRGEIYLAGFPFGDAPGMKLRPVLLLAGPIGPSSEVVVAYISSVAPQVMLASDMPIDPQSPAHLGSGFKVASVLRLHKVATIHASSVQRRLGALDVREMKGVDSKLRLVLSL